MLGLGWLNTHTQTHKKTKNPIITEQTRNATTIDMTGKLPLLRLNNNQPKQLQVQLKGIDKIWAFRNTINVPISHVESIEVVEHSILKGKALVKVVGAGIGGYKVGTFYDCRRYVFVDVHHPDGKIIIVTLRDERFKELILQIDDESENVVEQLQKMIDEAIEQ